MVKTHHTIAEAYGQVSEMMLIEKAVSNIKIALDTEHEQGTKVTFTADSKTIELIKSKISSFISKDYHAQGGVGQATGDIDNDNGWAWYSFWKVQNKNFGVGISWQNGENLVSIVDNTYPMPEEPAPWTDFIAVVKDIINPKFNAAPNRKYELVLEPDEIDRLRTARVLELKGYTSHNKHATFVTNNRQELIKKLDKYVDFGATSPDEVLGNGDPIK